MNLQKGYFGLINEFYSQHLDKEVILAYDGNVTHQVMKAFTQLVEEKLESERENETTIRRLYHVMVECLQNINRHAEVFYSDGKEHYPGRGALLLSKSPNHYRVITANLIRQSQVAGLKEFLDNINHLSEEELNERYKQQLMEGTLSPKGGAGLGFIDIRRKTENTMDYHFVSREDNSSFFLFNVLITRK